MTRRALGLLALVLLASALFAGCGSDSDSSTSTTANTPETKGKSYANTVCFIAISWRTVSDKISGYEGKSASSQDVDDALSQAQAATSTYLGTIRGLQQPDDPTGQAAYASLQKTADEISSLSMSIETSVNSLETDAKQAQAQIESLYGALKTSVSQLDKLYPQTDVAAAVAAQQNCAPLQS